MGKKESVVMVMAEWIKDYDEDYCCSECGHYLEPYELLPHLIIPNECPDCGAKMDKEWATMPCKKCGLQYSSYCVDCVYVKTGLNLNDEEYHEILKLRREQEWKPI